MATSEKRRYSSFWGLMILAWAMGIWMAFHIAALVQEKQILLADLQRVLPQSRQAIEAQKRYVAFVEDLRQLAPSDPNADRILNEFKLRQSAEKPTSFSPNP